MKYYRYFARVPILTLALFSAAALLILAGLAPPRQALADPNSWTIPGMEKVGVIHEYPLLRMALPENRTADIEWERVLGGTLDGAYYENLYWGGVSGSFPELVDMDADGDLDLFVVGNPRQQNANTELRFYRNDGDAAAPDWTFITDQYFGEQGHQFRFVDLDGDADFDCVMLTWDHFFTYENIGSPANPAWQKGGFDIPYTGEAWGYINFNFADIDADDDQDLFFITAGDITSINFMENIGTASEPAWAESVFHYWSILGKGVPWEGPPEPGEPEAYFFANIVFADIDNDSDLDLFLGGPTHITFYRNEGTAASADWVFVTNEYGGINYGAGMMHYNLAFGDLDGDGDLDLIIGHEGGWLTLFENTGTSEIASWAQWQNPMFPMHYGFQANPALGDLDDDGDLDLLMGVPQNWASPHGGRDIVYLRNDGTPTLPSWTFISGSYQDISCPGEMFPTLVDIDDDGDLDLFTGSRAFFSNDDSYFCFYENTGSPSTPNFQFVTDAYLGIHAPYGDYYRSVIHPAFADIDNDGDYDLFVAVQASIHFYRNNGGAYAPVWTFETDQYLGAEAYFLAFGDLDGDGDLDLTTDREIFLNIGDAGNPHFVRYPLATGLVFSGGPPALGDLLGNDGVPDLLLGGNGGLHLYRNRGLFCTHVTEIPTSECEELMLFYDITNGPQWNNRDGWFENYTPCSWYGVACDGGHVTELHLDSNNLSGELLYISGLTGLRVLGLESNQLYGEIPDGIGNLTNLASVNMGGNAFTGEIPASIGNLTNLGGTLLLHDNQLTGAIPAELGNLTGVEILNLWGNQLTGTIPAELGNMTALKELVLGNNQLTGNLPAELGDLTNLDVMWLAFNSLSGPVPAEFANLANMDAFGFSYTQICQEPEGVNPALDTWYAGILVLETTGFACTGGSEVSGMISLATRQAGATQVHITGTDRGVMLSPEPDGSFGDSFLPGDYHVQPESPGYDYIPEYYDITVPPDALGLDFTFTVRGGWLDAIHFVVEPDINTAITRILAGEIDVHTYASRDYAALETAITNGLAHADSFGMINELTLNPYGPEFNNGKFNPFAIREIRAAMNKLINREYIASEFYHDLAQPRLTALHSAFPDAARYQDIIETLAITYTYDLAAAGTDISAAMLAAGAVLSDSVWHYAGEPITLTFLIRVEDQRLQIGDYIADQLEAVGFVVDRQYKTSGEASPYWLNGNVADGEWHLYTGGWLATVFDRDEGENFEVFLSNRAGYSGLSLWANYEVPPDLDEVYTRLVNNEYATFAERDALFEEALEGSLYWSNRVFLVDAQGFAPYHPDVQLVSDLTGGLTDSDLLPYTLGWKGQPYGEMTLSLPGIFNEPWNPVDGTGVSNDQTVQSYTSDPALLSDPQTGLMLAHQVEHAGLLAVQDSPVTSTLGWVTLDFTTTITVPPDAWVGWDAVNQVWISAAEMYTAGVNVQAKSTVHYPADLFDTVKWHDGSPLSPADFVMGMILPFDRANPDSPIYDPDYSPDVLNGIVGYRVVLTNPLVIETYFDGLQLDAENNIRSLWPNYGHGEAPWHVMAAAYRAEAAGLTAFGGGKADWMGVPWMDFISGPTLGIMQGELAQAAGESYIPYPNVLGAYLSNEEVDDRYSSLQTWYEVYGHFWLGTGPYMLTHVNFGEPSATLSRSAHYPHGPGQWSEYLPEEEMPYTLFHQDFVHSYFGNASTLYIQNTSGEEVNLALTFYDLETSTSYVVNRVVPAHGQMTGSGADFYGIPEGKRYALKVGSDQVVTSQVNTRADIYTSLFASIGVPAGGLRPGENDHILFPAMKGDVNSSVSLWNPGESSVNIMLTFYNQNGVQVHQIPVILPPGGRYSAYLTAMAEIPAGFTGIVLVNAENRVEASLLSQFAGFHEQEYYPPAGAAATTQYLPRAMKAYDEGGGAHTTKLYLANMGSADAYPQIILYDINGTAVGNWGFLSLDPGATWVLDLAGIGQSSAPGNVYSARATSDQPFVLGELTRYNALANDQAYAFEAVFQQNGTTHYIPRVSRQPGDYSVIHIHNPSSSQAAVTLTLYDAGGTVVDTINLNLTGKASYRWDASKAASLGDDFIGTAKIEATQPVAMQVDEYQLAPYNLPELHIGKTALAQVMGGEPITYTLAVTNTSGIIATGLVITDILPVGATYVSGGSLSGDVVTWMLPNLLPGASAQVQFQVVAMQTITNTSYAVTSVEDVRAVGTDAVVTEVVTGFCSLVTDIPKAECEALEAFYQSTGGPGWTDNTGWLTTNTACTWYGLTCNSGHVSELFLQWNTLSGTLTADLANLPYLTTLDLNNNPQLGGAIPPELGQLTALENLSLYQNTMTGPIPPELGNLTNLKVLFLSYAQFSGQIPVELGSLVNLERLLLAHTQLSGPIPPAFGGLHNLDTLFLTNNQLSGPIPPELGSLPNLVNLRLSENQLSGPIPAALGSLTDLYRLELANNQLSGEIPAALAQLDRLGSLKLEYNMLWAADPALLTFLDVKAPGWAQTQTIPPTDLTASLVPGVDNANLGWRATVVGDVNNDGYDDVMLRVSIPSENTAKALLYLGSPTGLRHTPVLTMTGENDGDSFGNVAGAGDVNFDGYDDVIIGASGYPAGAGQGKIYIYLGTPAGLNPVPFFTAMGEGTPDYFGTSVAGAGDVNNDGYDDILVGASHYPNGGALGRVYVYHGGTTMSAVPAFFDTGFPGSIPSRYSRLGTSVSTAGDVNGDGYDDIIVGAEYYSIAHQNGRAHVYLGGPSGITAPPVFAFNGENSMSYLGHSVGTAGDVNGDGYDDVIIGAYGYPSNQRQGRAYIFLGGPAGPDTTPDFVYTGQRSGDFFGRAVETAGDVNGDGFDDVIIGASMYDNGQTDEGRAYLYLGSAAGLTGPAWTAESDQPYAYFGSIIGASGDVNGDGYSDVVIGVYAYDHAALNGGRAYGFYGSPAGLSAGPDWVAEIPYIALSWTPILYTADGGHYEVSYAPNLAGPYTVHGYTEDKLASSYELTGLAPDVYYIRLRTHTPAHGTQQNDLWSEYSTPLQYSSLSITGKKFNDLNGNGAWDTGEPPLAGWTIYLDLNNNSTLDAGEPTAMTGADGSYLFANLPPGLYRVREVQQANWGQTFPAGPGFVHVVDLLRGQVGAGLNFGNKELPPPVLPPLIFDITPESGYNDLAVPVAIYGERFEVGAVVHLDGPSALRDVAAMVPLTVTSVTFNQIQAIVPPGIPVGLYDLVVTNPSQLNHTLVQAYTANERIAPIVTGISPATGPEDRAITLDITGKNFASELTVTLKTMPGEPPFEIQLGNILYDSSTQIKVIVPQKIPLGKYILTVTNIGGLSDIDPGGVEDDFYEVLPVTLSNDLFITPEEIRMVPHTVREGMDGLIQTTIRRRDGVNNMTDIGVFFFVTNDATAATVYMELVVVPVIAPNDIVTVTTNWAGPLPGNYTIWAVADYANDYDEADELNNLASRKVVVLPPAPDTTPPVVTSFTINNGADATASRQVLLNTTAVDPPGGPGEPASGIAYLKFLEFIYDANTLDFREVARSEWLPYNQTAANYPWRIQPDPGLRYLQVWASDGAGNVSAQPMEAFINLLITLPQLLEGQGTVYRFNMTAGQRITVTLVSLGGIADLYVWSPDWLPGEEPVITDMENANEKIRAFDALVTGAYQIEIEAFSNTFYQLRIERGPASGRDVTIQGASLREPYRGRITPLVDVNATPSNYQGMETPPVQTGYRLFLPLVRR